MIVKNEAHIIKRCIENVKPFIDAWVIVDTGSTDNTKEVALEALKGIPGEFTSTPWTGFGDARTVALKVADKMMEGKLAYAWTVDADDIWEGKITPEDLTEDGHAVWFVQHPRTVWVKDGIMSATEIEGVAPIQLPAARWSTTRFLKLGRGWTYKGVVHEEPVTPDKVYGSLLECIIVTSRNDGASWKNPDKHLTYAKMIATAMVEDPLNSRYAFYLAQSYRDHGDDLIAARMYLKRTAMGDGEYAEEVYISFLEAGRAFLRLGELDKAEKTLLAAHSANPKRREAMWELGQLFLVKAATSPDAGTLFVEAVPNNFKLVIDQPNTEPMVIPLYKDGDGNQAIRD